MDNLDSLADAFSAAWAAQSRAVRAGDKVQVSTLGEELTRIIAAVTQQRLLLAAAPSGADDDGDDDELDLPDEAGDDGPDESDFADEDEELDPTLPCLAFVTQEWLFNLDATTVARLDAHEKGFGYALYELAEERGWHGVAKLDGVGGRSLWQEIRARSDAPLDDDEDEEDEDPSEWPLRFRQV